MKKVTISNTKKEILEAYDEIIKFLNERSAENSALKKELADKNTKVNEARDIISNNDPLVSIEQFRANFNSQIDTIKNEVALEKERFLKIQDAIKIEKDTLENIYKIKTEAESLEALIATNEKAKESLQNEIQQQKLDWKRQEDNYNYELKIKRRNENDLYQQEKKKLEQELKNKKELFDKTIRDREHELASKENEFKELKANAQTFEETLKKAIENTEKEITDRLQKEYNFKQKLDNKDLEIKIKLFQQEIDTLKLKVKEQQDIINKLNETSSRAGNQVKDIALKAIEGASSNRWFNETSKRIEPKED